jgi:Holliday junction resolvase RusA-like endonuclease|tara:strand:- start:92 stop:484 length:393 start_codon:yes stop_codon:yes gene_type:complete
MSTGTTSLVVYKGIIYGEPASKANSRKIVMFGKRPAIIKSQKARDYVVTFQKQCLILDELITEDVCVEITIFYASRRPDLDESVILDCMQDFIYKNDRQVKKKIICWGLDRENPRAEIKVSLLEEDREDG